MLDEDAFSNIEKVHDGSENIESNDVAEEDLEDLD